MTAPMRKEAGEKGDIKRMQAWAGQSALLASTEPAGVLTKRLWSDALKILD